MGLYTILMNNSTKQLIATNKIRLHQHEAIRDKLCFVIDFDYSPIADLRDFQVVVEWLDPTNVAHVDILEKEEEIYKEKYQRYFLPVKSPINRYAGEIELKLVFTKTDYETTRRYKLESEPITVEISTIKDYYAVLPNESFDGIADMISQLQAQTDALTAAADVYDKSKADSITLDQKTNELQLTARGEKIGEAVVIDLIDEKDKELDKLDGKVDGVIDLDDIDWETVTL